MTPVEVLQFAKENGARQVDVRFSDIPRLQHHISYPVGELTEAAIMDPFMETPTLVMIGDVRDPLTKQNYERDPRWIAKKAELYLRNSGAGDTAFFGAEAEFFIFDNVRFAQNAHSGFYF